MASPLLSNIYLDRLDKFAGTILIPEYTRGARRTASRAYATVNNAIRAARRRGDRAAARKLRQQRQGLPYGEPRDPGYRRLRYIRYADDHLFGFTGTKAEAEQIKQRPAQFLREDLKLELSPGQDADHARPHPGGAVPRLPHHHPAQPVPPRRQRRDRAARAPAGDHGQHSPLPQAR